MSLDTLSLRAALRIWSDLDDAYYGRANFGSAAEIYAYRLMPYVPTAVAAKGSPLDDERFREATQHAAAALTSLCRLFAAEREVTVRIDGMTLGMAFLGRAFDHRCRVEVIHATTTPTPTRAPREETDRA